MIITLLSIKTWYNDLFKALAAALKFEVSLDFCAPLYCVWVEVHLKSFVSLLKKPQKTLGAHCQLLERGQREEGWGPALPGSRLLQVNLVLCLSGTICLQ